MAENNATGISLNFFDQGSPFLSHPALTGERTGAEVDFAVTKLALRPGARVLDVGCGFGRHAIELARRGFEVVGIDPAAAMLDRARELATGAGVNVDFLQIPAEDFVPVDKFDGAICLMTTLGQVTAGADNLGLIQRVYDALNSGGRFLVEVPQRDSTVNSLIEADTFRLKGQITEVRREYDEMSKSITETFDIVTTAESRRYILRYSLFDWPELSALFEGGGFKVLEAFADSNGTPLLPESINMWCVGRK